MAILTSSVTNSTPQAVKMPLGLKLLYDALTPTLLKFKTGNISYNWDTSTSAWGQPPAYKLQTSNGFVNFGVPTGNPINGYPTIVDPGQYTTELGLAAWTQLQSFVATLPSYEMAKLVPQTQLTIMANDSSSFHAVYSELGQSTASAVVTGTITTEVYGEVITQSPVFAKFAEYQTDTRSFIEMRGSSSTPGYLGKRLLLFKSQKSVHNKQKPVGKPISMVDIFDSLSVGLATASLNSRQQNAIQHIAPSTVTVQQAMIIIRTICAGYSSTPGAYDWSITGATNFRPLQPNLSDVNVASYARKILLPDWLVENLRAFAPILAKVGRKQLGPDTGLDVIEWYPVFGLYEGEVALNYSVVPQLLLYMEAPGEIPINYLNATTNNNEQLCLAGDQLDVTITTWNTWMTTFKPYIQLNTFDYESSNSVLSSLVYTRYVVSQPEIDLTKKLPRTKSVNAPRGFALTIDKTRFHQVAPVGMSNQGTQGIVSISGNVNFIESVWSPLLTWWVLPKIVIPTYDTSVAPYRVGFMEPYEISIQSTTYNDLPRFPLLAETWVCLATLFTSTILGTPTDTQTLLTQAAKQGMGGFLGQAMADFAASVTGIPFLSSLGSLIPF